MTLPPNIKEEIEKATCYVNNDLSYCLVYDIRIIMKEIATQFYLKGVGDRDAIAKAAFEAGREGERPIVNTELEGDGVTVLNTYGDWVDKYKEAADYLASDEYKKLVGEM